MSTGRWKVHDLHKGRGYDARAREAQEALDQYGYAYVEDVSGSWRVVWGSKDKLEWTRCDPPTPLEKERQLRWEEERVREEAHEASGWGG